MTEPAGEQPQFDADGYPTEHTLQLIKQWPTKTVADCEALISFVRRAWHWPDYAIRDGQYLRLVTGGWSGNESIIAALEKNVMFWTLFWQESGRGGGFTFRLDRFPYVPVSPQAAPPPTPLPDAPTLCDVATTPAPRTGEHFLAINFDQSWGTCGGKNQHPACVVHYWSEPDTEGFYPSLGPDEPFAFTHWKSLPRINALGEIAEVKPAVPPDPPAEPPQLFISVWPFADAPEALQKLSDHGGDEDWVVLFPPRYANQWAPWVESLGSVSEFFLPDGSKVVIGAHA